MDPLEEVVRSYCYVEALMNEWVVAERIGVVDAIDLQHWDPFESWAWHHCVCRGSVESIHCPISPSNQITKVHILADSDQPTSLCTAIMLSSLPSIITLTEKKLFW